MSDSHGKQTNFLSIFMLWFAGLAAAGQFAKFSVTFSQFAAIYPDAGNSLGLLVSLIGLLGIIFGLFAGLAVTRIGFRRALLFALILGAILSTYQATLPAFPIMLASRMIEGISHLMIVVAAPTLIAQLSHPRHINMSMTLWSTFFGVAFTITSWFGLPLVDHFGLQSLLLAHAVIMLIIAIYLAKILPKNTTKKPDEKKLSTKSILRSHFEIYRSPFMSAPALGWLFYTLTYVSLLTVLPSLLPEESRDLMSGILPIVGIVSSLFVGTFLLRYFKAVNIVIASFLGASATLSLYWLKVDIALIAFVAFFVLGLIQSSSFAAIPQLNDKSDDQANANGALAQMGNLGNTLGTPILLILLSNYDIQGLITGIIIIYLLGAAAHFLLELRRRKFN